MLVLQTEARIADLQSRRAQPDDYLIPGARPLVENLATQGLMLVIASGTNQADVRRESDILKIDHYFGPRIFGPVNDNPQFSKERVLQQLMTEQCLRGEEIVSIGDGPAEMLAIKQVGGLAVGVASDEVHQDGRINRLKHDHLLRSGADVIIPDYRHLSAVLQLLSLDS
jgi:phosphoglycolate phosphatase-like HAD superfamily hydrolase